MPRLEVKSVSMEFPAVRALDGVSITFTPGEVHGIVGENGAGKSTLMKILSGVQAATSGQILLDDNPVGLTTVRDALKHGIAMIHQELNLVDELSVAENVFLGREISKLGVLDRTAMIEQTRINLEQVHANFPATTKVGDLSIAGKQLVEIAKAVAQSASILIMDEPTAVLSEPESEALFALIKKLKESGTTVLYISHRLSEVCAICDRITVLRDGKFIKTLLAPQSNPVELAGLMVGRPLADFYPPKNEPPVGDPVLEAVNVRGASFCVNPGEVLGIAGLVGAGRTELAEAIVGVRSAEGGHIVVEGAKVCPRNTKEAKRYGIAYVSEDRKGLGLHLSLSVGENITLANLQAYGNVVIDVGRERATTQSWTKDLDIRAADPTAAVDHVSGGNQQKIAIAKWLETKPKVIILDEPTRGVDVGAKREMYNLIQRLAAQGMACIVISSELPEIIGICHRAIVMREGRIVGELTGKQLTEEGVMVLAAGVQSA